MKDFDIVKAAQGVDKVVIVDTKAVQVANRSLEIRFHWSGKGTTASPERGVYGPLISAISIEPGKLLNLHINGFMSVKLHYRFWYKLFCTQSSIIDKEP